MSELKKLSVHQIWKKCVSEGTIEQFKDILIEHGHIQINDPGTKICDKCGHKLPISYFNNGSESCYYCE